MFKVTHAFQWWGSAIWCFLKVGLHFGPSKKILSTLAFFGRNHTQYIVFPTILLYRLDSIFLPSYSRKVVTICSHPLHNILFQSNRTTGFHSYSDFYHFQTCENERAQSQLCVLATVTGFLSPTEESLLDHSGLASRTANHIDLIRIVPFSILNILCSSRLVPWWRSCAACKASQADCCKM